MNYQPDLNKIDMRGVAWRSLYEMSTPLNNLTPYSLGTFKQNVKRLLELGPVDQKSLNSAKTRPALGCEREFVVYRITHIESGMKYFGITDDFTRRKNSHRRANENIAIHAAIRKYGWPAFQIEIVVKGTMTRSMACRIERAFILEEKTLFPKGFNRKK